jgi:hypothetical protein
MEDNSMADASSEGFEFLHEYNKIYREARKQVLSELIEFLIQKYSEVALDHSISDIEKTFWGDLIRDTQEIKEAMVD